MAKRKALKLVMVTSFDDLPPPMIDSAERSRLKRVLHLEAPVRDLNGDTIEGELMAKQLHLNSDIAELAITPERSRNKGRVVVDNWTGSNLFRYFYLLRKLKFASDVKDNWPRGIGVANNLIKRYGISMAKLLCENVILNSTAVVQKYNLRDPTKLPSIGLVIVLGDRLVEDVSQGGTIASRSRVSWLNVSELGATKEQREFDEW